MCIRDSKVTEANNLNAETMKMAVTISEKLSSAVKIGKEAFYKQLELSVDDAYDYTAGVITENMLRRDTEEGISAFIEKRLPNWED